MATAESKQKEYIFDSASLYYGDIDITKPDEILNNLTNMLLGLSNEGITLTVSNEIFLCPVQGSNEKQIKGLQRVLRTDGSIEGSIMKFDRTLLTMSLYESASDITSTKYDVYAPLQGEIKPEKYKGLLMVAKKGNEDWIVFFPNTYNSNGLEVENPDGDNAKAKVKFNACYDPEDLSKPPVYIFMPKQATGV